MGSSVDPLGPSSTWGSPKGPISKFMESKILPIKVVWYDSLIIKIPLKGELTYYVVSGELHIINLENTSKHFTSPIAPEALCH